MILYLDNAATTFPKPREVTEGVLRCLREYCGNPGRSGHRLSLKSAEQIYACRCEICSFFHYPTPENVVFVSNATHALNMAINAYLPYGSHILLSDLEHNAVYRTVFALSSDGKATFDIFSHRGDIIENIARQLRSNTSAVICTQASNVTGFQMPLQEIGSFCQKHRLHLIVDGAQGAGHIKTDLGSFFFSAYCSSGHKGLYGIQGCGFAIMNHASPLRDYMQGGTGSDSFLTHMPHSLPDRYEAGTLPTPGIVSLLEGIRYLQNHTEDTEAENELVRLLTEDLSNINGIEVFSKAENPCGIVSFRLKGMSSSTLDTALNQSGICARGGVHCAPLAHLSVGSGEGGLLRISFGIFNTKADVKRTVDTVFHIASGV